MPGPIVSNPTSGDPVRIFHDGEWRWFAHLSPEEQQEWRNEHRERYEKEDTPESAVTRAEEASDEIGLPTTGDEFNLVQSLQRAGVDTDHPQVATWIQAQLPALEAGAANEALLQAQISALAMNPEFSSTTATQYTAALEASGFDGPWDPSPLDQFAPGATAIREGGFETTAEVQAAIPKQGPFRVNPETDWIQFRNGVLVDPNTGQVFYQPGSEAPGSPTWRLNVQEWAPSKVSEWKKRLHELGYLSKDQAKAQGVDTVFTNALALYHQNRYLNGGNPIAGDLTVSGAGGSAAPKAVDLEDFSTQIRNDVREQYERVYGVRPSDGEVQLWTDYIIKNGMDLQRKFRRKYESPMTDTAATEAEEMFVEKLEGSPAARFLRESEEENTRLRDTFERMAQVTASLAG